MHNSLMANICEYDFPVIDVAIMVFRSSFRMFVCEKWSKSEQKHGRIARVRKEKGKTKKKQDWPEKRSSEK